tara:strand:+ start:309 stop:476 length:168 start_codon:yes stop_codon:yes gene_type:complete
MGHLLERKYGDKSDSDYCSASSGAGIRKPQDSVLPPQLAGKALISMFPDNAARGF